MSLPRPLSDAEAEVVQWMIEHGGAHAQIYREQLAGAMVVGQCPCGCASIDFQVPRMALQGKEERQLIGDYLYGPEDVPFGAFLIATNGRLSRFEVYSHTAQPAPLPSPEDLRPWANSRYLDPAPP